MFLLSKLILTHFQNRMYVCAQLVVAQKKFRKCGALRQVEIQAPTPSPLVLLTDSSGAPGDDGEALYG